MNERNSKMFLPCRMTGRTEDEMEWRIDVYN